MSEKRLCNIYKSLREQEMYLFVDREEDLSRVPEALLSRFGTPQLVTTLALNPERRLARADATAVLARIREQGYYLQMPPSRADLLDHTMADLDGRNQKLPR